MPVEQGLPWHPVATGLAGQTIPFIVVASHAHALPAPPFWFPVPAVLVASPALLCPSSLSVVFALVPPGVAPAFCVSVLLLPMSVDAPGCPCRAPLLVPPACPPIQGFHISVRRGLSRARLAGHGPVATPMAGTSRRAGRSSHPCGVRGHLVEGGGGGGVVDGSLGMRHIWWLLQCLHLMVPLCIVVCPVGARLTAVCGAAMCPLALLLAFLPILGSFFFYWHAHCCWCAVPGGAACRSLNPLVAVGLSHLQLGGTRGTKHSCTCLQIYKLTCHWCLLGLFCGECDVLLLFCFLGG